MHGSFELGIILVGIFFGSELIRNVVRHRRNLLQAFTAHKKIKTYFFLLLSVLLASCINPYGYSIYALVEQMLADTETLKNVVEWFPLPWDYFFKLQIDEKLGFILLVWAAFVTLCIKVYQTIKKFKKFYLFLQHVCYEDLLLFLGSLASAIQYNRGTHMLAFMSAFLIVRNANLWLSAKGKKEWMSVILFAALLGFTFLNIRLNLQLNTGPSEFIQPKEAFDFIQKNKPKGNLLNEYAGGSELIWYLYPQYKVFIDGRAANVYDADYYWHYLNLNNETIFKTLTDRYDLQIMLGPITWDIGKNIASRKDWSLVFFDNYSSVYVKSSANEELAKRYTYTTLTPLLDLHSIEKICDDPEKKKTLLNEVARNIHELEHPLFSYQVIAQLAIKCNEGPDALSYAEKLMKVSAALQPQNSDIYNNLGVLELKLGNYEDAKRSFKQSITLHDTKENLTGYATALYNLNEYEKSLSIFKKIIDAPGDFPNEYYQVYGRVSYKLGNNTQAISFAHRYLDLIDISQITAQDYTDLANAYASSGQGEQAQEYTAKAEALVEQKKL
jgi:tetratricopeptide (TPR) repeat protein